MRSSLVLLAGLASSALAYPTDVAAERRTFGLVSELLGGATHDVVSFLEDVLGGHSFHRGSASLLGGLNAHGAAALEGGALGCSHTKIHESARAHLKTWLSGSVSISGSLKTSLLAWCEGEVDVLATDVIAALAVYIPTCAELCAKESLYVTIDGIFSAAELASDLVLSASAQLSLGAWIDIAVGLDADIKAGLSVCAGGGLITSLDAGVKAKLLAWITGGSCSLDASLKASVLAWLHGRHGGDLVAIGELGFDALNTISVGASAGVFVSEGGALSVHAQAMLAAFLDTSIAADIDADILLGLQGCAKGDLATAIELDVRTKLAVWLSGSSCSLGVELKAVVLLWLSLGATADVSLDLVSGLFVDITEFLSVTVIDLLSVNLRGALSLLACGESLDLLSFEARAELAAFLSGCTSIDIGVNVELIIFEWFTGCSMPGAPAASSSTPSLPSATASIISSVPLPSGVAPTGSASIPSGSVPGGVIPTGSIPTGGSAPSGSSPAGTIPSGTVPTGGSVPSGTSPTGSVPAGTVPSGTVPTGGSGSTGSSSGSSGSTGSGSGSSGSTGSTGSGSGSGSSGSTGSGSSGSTGSGSSGSTGSGSGSGSSGSTGSGSGASGSTGSSGSGSAETTTPCETETSTWVTSTVISGTPSPVTVTGVVPAGTVTVGGSGSSPATITETSVYTTHTVVSGTTSTITITDIIGGSVPTGAATTFWETESVWVTSTVISGYTSTITVTGGSVPAATGSSSTGSGSGSSGSTGSGSGSSGSSSSTGSGSGSSGSTGSGSGSGSSGSTGSGSGSSGSTGSGSGSSGSTGSGSGSGVVPSGSSPVESGHPCETMTVPYVTSTVISGTTIPVTVAPTGAPGNGVSPVDTSSAPAPAVTSAPAVPSSGSATTTETQTVTVTATVCGCE
ncbi:hypothetical protein N7523_008194 [Penicillium sp. IBT 18751x]|nr:hypothetical protein N7523_008194 [Penicillium sp. IBT 18751x]